MIVVAVRKSMAMRQTDIARMVATNIVVDVYALILPNAIPNLDKSVGETIRYL